MNYSNPSRRLQYVAQLANRTLDIAKAEDLDPVKLAEEVSAHLNEKGGKFYRAAFMLCGQASLAAADCGDSSPAMAEDSADQVKAMAPLSLAQPLPQPGQDNEEGGQGE